MSEEAAHTTNARNASSSSSTSSSSSSSKAGGATGDDRAPGCQAAWLPRHWLHPFTDGTATTVSIAADRQVVFDHLIEPRTFPEWLLGAQHIRATDDAWPATGSAFHHRVGIGPLGIEDSTRVVHVDPPDEIVLEASIGAFGSARVRFVLTGSDPTVVCFEELPTTGPLKLADRTAGFVATRASIWGRNRASLERLKRLIEGSSRA